MNIIHHRQSFNVLRIINQFLWEESIFLKIFKLTLNVLCIINQYFPENKSIFLKIFKLAFSPQSSIRIPQIPKSPWIWSLVLEKPLNLFDQVQYEPCYSIHFVLQDTERRKPAKRPPRMGQQQPPSPPRSKNVVPCTARNKEKNRRIDVLLF